MFRVLCLSVLFLLTVKIPVVTVNTNDIHDGCPFVPSSTPRGNILIHVCMHVRIYVHARISTPIQPCIYPRCNAARILVSISIPPQPPSHLHSFFFFFLSFSVFFFLGSSSCFSAPQANSRAPRRPTRHHPHRHR